ncbi:MAG: AAA family ATPase [Deltaproteobacteria bacterium]|nr:AAA family ATPase [Deltaproteobacteria bacterium]
MSEIKQERENPSGSEGKVPNQKELEKELTEYLSKKYGDRVKIITPLVFPKGETEETEPSVSEKGKTMSKINFEMKPEELEAYLDEYVVCQDEAKAVLATKICTHFNRIRYWERQGKDSGAAVGLIKNNIIMIGPTGVGKTYLIKLIAKKLGVPFVKGDATKFSETGYVGGDVEDLVRDLVLEAGDDIELAQYGIVYIDEIDKIASSHNLIGPDVSRTGVQRALLKPLEEAEIDLRVPHDPISQLQAIERYRKTGKKEKRTINTKHILFIVSGAFNHLDEIIRKRLQEKGLGFGARLKSRELAEGYHKQVRSEDFMAFGFETEFVGRLPVTVVLDSLEVDDLFQILKNPNNPVIRSKKADFKAYGIDILFEEEALRLLAEMAFEEKTGARGLVSAVEKVLLKFEKRFPSTEIKRLLVTSRVVEDPEGELTRLLADPERATDLEAFQQAWDREKSALLERLRHKAEETLGKFETLLTETRLRIVADRHLELGLDIPQAFEEIRQMIGQVREYEMRFFERVGISLKFSEEGVDAVLNRAQRAGVSVWSICENFSKDFEYGFKLVQEKTGLNRFLITTEAIEDTEAYIQKLLQTYFAKESQ